MPVYSLHRFEGPRQTAPPVSSEYENLDGARTAAFAAAHKLALDRRPGDPPVSGRFEIYDATGYLRLVVPLKDILSYTSSMLRRQSGS